MVSRVYVATQEENLPFRINKENMNGLTVRPGSSDPFYIVSYYLKWVTTSWTHSMTYPVLQIMFNLLKFEAKKYCAHFKLISTNLNMILSEKKCWHLKIICFFYFGRFT